MELTKEEIKALSGKLAERIPYKWRVQSYSKSKATAICVAYIDSRDVQNRLDEVIGISNWQTDYKEHKNNLFCGIGIKFADEWVWKWDCGTESKEDAEKGEASDSFKRAAVKWGIGRFLYSEKIQYINASEVKNKSNFPYPIDEKGNRVWDVTEFINNKIKNNKQPAPIKNPTKPQELKKKTQLNIHSEELKEMVKYVISGQSALVRKKMANYTFTKDALTKLNKTLEKANG